MAVDGGNWVGFFERLTNPRHPGIPPEVFTVFGWYIFGGPNTKPQEVFGCLG